LASEFRNLPLQLIFNSGWMLLARRFHHQLDFFGFKASRKHQIAFYILEVFEAQRDLFSRYLIREFMERDTAGLLFTLQVLDSGYFDIQITLKGIIHGRQLLEDQFVMKCTFRLGPRDMENPDADALGIRVSARCHHASIYGDISLQSTYLDGLL